MTILHFTDLNEKVKSGISEVVENLATHFIKIGINSNVLTIDNSLDENNNKYVFIQNLSEFKKKVQGEKKIIVIFHSVYKYKFLKYYFFCIKNNIEFFIHPHGGLTKDNFKKNTAIKFIFFHLILKKIIKKAEALIFLSQKEFNNNFIKINSNYIFISNGINPFVKNKLNSKYYLYDDVRKINFLFFGRIDINHKGIDKLIEGIELLPEKIKNQIIVNFYGYGNVKDENYLLEKIKNNSNIKFHGSVFDPIEKNNVFLSSDIFILTSRYEGMPISVLEALSSGLPCLVSTETNVEDIILKYKCGWVIDKNTPNNISKTIQIAIEEYKLNKQLLIENSILCANNNFTWSSVVDKASRFFIK